MSLLFTPYDLGGVTVKNRIVMPPMCMYSVEDDSGVPNNFHLLHYGARALGGTGLIIVEATGVEPRGRISNRDLGLWNDAQRAGHTKVVQGIHAYGPCGTEKRVRRFPMCRSQCGRLLTGVSNAKSAGGSGDRGDHQSVCGCCGTGERGRLRHPGTSLRPWLSADRVSLAAD